MPERASPPIDARAVLPPGREVVRTFVDSATGYCVIEHAGADEPPVPLTIGDPESGAVVPIGTTRAVHVTLVDLRTGEVVPIERRMAEIPSGEIVRIDEARGLRLSTRHTIDPLTGHETLDEVLSDLATGATLSRGASSALQSTEHRRGLLEAHLERLELQRAEEAFWRDEYPRWSFEKRADHWYRMIRLQMRSQGEWGLDEYAAFTPEAYAAWRARDAEIDRILDAVIELLDPSDRVAIDRRLGRTTQPRRSRKKTTARRRRPR